MSELDNQEGGDHYKKLGIYQPWVVLSKWMTPEELKGAMKKDVIGYLCREADKGGREDIKKAHHTLGIYLELTEEKTELPVGDTRNVYCGCVKLNTPHLYQYIGETTQAYVCSICRNAKD